MKTLYFDCSSNTLSPSRSNWFNNWYCRYSYSNKQNKSRKREFEEIDTKYGKIKAKKIINEGKTYIYPEYESMKKLAEENNIPLKELYKLDELKRK